MDDMMDKMEKERRIEAGRNFTRCIMDVPGFVSDQDQKLPQPPLVKAPMTQNAFRLPHDFSKLNLSVDYAKLVASRRTRRVYSGEPLTLDELSFILFASQGVESIRGKKYATLRTVPSGGARHAFETYIAVNSVTGLKSGIYHYLPMNHSIEFLHTIDDAQSTICDMLSGQRFAAKASAVLFLSMIPYRAEWRYGIYAHRIAMVDLGHVGQAVYLAAEALGLGTCGIGAFDEARCNDVIGLDGNEEYTVYAQPIGRYMVSDAPKELEFYSFLDEDE